MAVPQSPPPQSLVDGAALFLDFDGTLVDLAEAPDAIHVAPHLDELLQRLHSRLEGRLAIISGRGLGDLDRHLRCSGIAMSGSHGLELRLADGSGPLVDVPDALTEAKERISRFAENKSGLLVEEKPVSVALHFRRAPEQEERVSSFMADLAASTGLIVQEGKMMVELRPGGADKGDALRSLMAEPAFAGAHPVFVGDDITDEDAFVAAAEMGGAGILVGPPRESAAQWRLPSVAAVATWLEQAAGEGQ